MRIVLFCHNLKHVNMPQPALRFFAVRCKAPHSPFFALAYATYAPRQFMTTPTNMTQPRQDLFGFDFPNMLRKSSAL